MQEKINKLIELSNINLYKDIDLATTWIDSIPLDKNKISRWNNDIVEILSSIDPRYAKQFTKFQQKVSEEWHLGDNIIDKNVENSKACLIKIIQKIKNIYEMKY